MLIIIKKTHNKVKFVKESFYNNVTINSNGFKINIVGSVVNYSGLFETYFKNINFSEISIQKLKIIASQIYTDIPGHYYIIIFSHTQLFLITDPYALLKLYYIEKNDELFLTDDYSEIIKIENWNVNYEALKYFFLRNYTPAKHTFIKNLYKCEPASVYLITEGQWRNFYYLHEGKEDINGQSFFIQMENDLRNHIQLHSSYFKKSSLFLSGGIDSTLLLYMYKNLHTKNNFKVLFGKMSGLDQKTMIDNDFDFKFSKKMTNNIKSELEVLDYNYSDDNVINDFYLIKKLLFNDYAISMGLHGFISKVDDEACIISGQNADSILSFGSLGHPKFQELKLVGLGGLVQRYDYFYKKNYLNPIYMLIRILFALDYYINYKICPMKFSEEDFLVGLMLNPKNKPYFHNDHSYNFIKDIEGLKEWLLNEYINPIKDRFPEKSMHSLSVLLYLNSYMQGSANRSNVASALFLKKNIFLPFTNLNLLNKMIRLKPDWRYVYYGKYPNITISKRYLKIPNYILERSDPNDSDSTDLIYNTLLKNINFMKYIDAEFKKINWEIYENVFNEEFFNQLRGTKEIKSNNISIILKLIWVNTIINEFK
jgi:hypothetical protein